MSPEVLAELAEIGLTREDLENYDCILTGIGRTREDGTKARYLPIEAFDLYKTLRAHGDIKVGPNPDDGRIQFVDLRGADLVLGAIYLLSSPAGSIMLGIISNWLYDRMKSLTSTRNEVSTVQLELKYRGEHGVTNVNYKGDPGTLLEIMKIMAQPKQDVGGESDE